MSRSSAVLKEIARSQPFACQGGHGSLNRRLHLHAGMLSAACDEFAEGAAFQETRV
jgi:hypothetical protein